MRARPGKKSATKKTSAKQATSGSGKSRSDQARTACRAAESEVGRRNCRAAAARQLGQLAAKEVEGVTGLERTDDGWRVELDVLELRRVPNTTDVLAIYEVLMDSDGDLDSYRRLHRYVRGSASEDRA